ncbi:MAG: YraN family protein [bacterium]|nr:YraN family protein [bacterium]
MLARNWRCSIGELDPVCRQGETYVFVEVKASRKPSALPPEARINGRKYRKLLSVTAAYRKYHSVKAPCRLDAVAVWWEDGKPIIRHFENVSDV